MKTFSIAIVAALVASAVASPAVEAHSRRTITTKVTLCEEANLHNCDDTFIPIDTCFKVPDCTVQSLNTGGHICDFYSESGCAGRKYQHAGIQENLPQGVVIRSVFCW